MENKKKKVKLDPILLRDLWSAEDAIVLKTLKKLRTVGNIGYIPELLNLLNKAPSETIRKELVLFIADVKDKAIIPFILAGLKNPELKGARESILAACWQSGLDYSQDLELIIQMFLEGDYATSLEAFTVIEEALFNIQEAEISRLQKLLTSGITKIDEEKKPLALELVKLLRDY